jgi:hypothetical protein
MYAWLNGVNGLQLGIMVLIAYLIVKVMDMIIKRKVKGE